MTVHQVLSPQVAQSTSSIAIAGAMTAPQIERVTGRFGQWIGGTQDEEIDEFRGLTTSDHQYDGVTEQQNLAASRTQLIALQQRLRFLRRQADALNRRKRQRDGLLRPRAQAIGMLQLTNVMTLTMKRYPKTRLSRSDVEEVERFRSALDASIRDASGAMMQDPIGFEQMTRSLSRAANHLRAQLLDRSFAREAQTVAQIWSQLTSSERREIRDAIMHCYAALLNTPEEGNAVADVERTFQILLGVAPRPTQIPTGLHPRFNAALTLDQPAITPRTALGFLASAADIGGRTVANIAGPNSLAVSLMSVFGPEIASRVRSVGEAQEAAGLMYRLVSGAARLNQTEMNTMLAYTQQTDGRGMREARELLTSKWPRRIGGALVFLNLVALLSVVTSDGQSTLAKWTAIAGTGLNTVLGGMALMRIENLRVQGAMKVLGGIAAVLSVAIAWQTASAEFTSGDTVGGVIASVDTFGAALSLAGYLIALGGSNFWNGIGEVLMLIGVIVGLISVIWGLLRSYFTAGPKRLAEGILAKFKEDGGPYANLLQARSRIPYRSQRDRINQMESSIARLERALNAASFWNISVRGIGPLFDIGFCPPQIATLVREDDDRVVRLLRLSGRWTAADHQRCARQSGEGESLALLGDDQLTENGAGRKLAASEVRYLVLEGGGGKGLVFLGALQELEQRQVLSQLQGVAGSSAGAITALGLSCGYNVAQLAQISSPPGMDFEEFFDIPQSTRQVPQLGQGCVNGRGQDILDRQVFARVYASLWSILNSNRLTRPIAQPVSQQAVQQLRVRMRNRAVQGIRRGDGLRQKLGSPASIYYARNLWDDLGVFSGCAAHTFLQNVIIAAGGTGTMTFREHFARFRKKLVITGSNLETGRTELFSHETTPGMAVADAVRISMGLPFIFKPVRISRSQAQRITQGGTVTNSRAYEGLWVDGGLWNNLPISVFARDEQGRPGTLGVALGRSAMRRTPVRDLGGMIGTVLSRFLDDETQLNTNPSYRQQVIVLDTDGIGTLDFSPPTNIVQRQHARARQEVVRYFR